MSVENIVNINESNLQQVLEQSMTTPVLFYFWSERSQHCLQLTPILESLAAQYNGQFILAKLDCDAEQMIAAQFGLRAIPTVYLFQNGQPVDGFQGPQPEEAIRALLDKVLPREEELKAQEAMALMQEGKYDEALPLLKDAWQLSNQNSQIGVPLTLSHLTREDEIAVLEIGMSERGQIEKLTNMIRPNVAVVTMIGVSHIAQLKTQENICLEKMDIVKGLPEDGMVFLNGDDKFLAPYRGKLSHKTFFYGMDKACDYRAENVHVKDGQTIFHFFYKEGKVIKDMEVVLGTMGEHNVRNALVALGVAHQMGLDMKAAAKALVTFHGQRQQMHTLKSCTLIDDTYNASPDSMKASVSVLSSMEGVKGRRIAALADMLELGEKEREYHYEVGKFIAGTQVDEVAAYGELSEEILKGVEDNNERIVVKHFESRDALKDYLLTYVHPDDVLLLKASNGMKLKEIAEAFLQNEKKVLK